MIPVKIAGVILDIVLQQSSKNATRGIIVAVAMVINSVVVVVTVGVVLDVSGVAV